MTSEESSERRYHRDSCPFCGLSLNSETAWKSHVRRCRTNTFSLGPWTLGRILFVVLGAVVLAAAAVTSVVWEVPLVV